MEILRPAATVQLNFSCTNPHCADLPNLSRWTTSHVPYRLLGTDVTGKRATCFLYSNMCPRHVATICTRRAQILRVTSCIDRHGPISSSCVADLLDFDVLRNLSHELCMHMQVPSPFRNLSTARNG